MERRANARGQGAHLAAELLDAATRLLEAGGRDTRLTLRGVAREAGVAAPSVYPHFADLDSLTLALVRRHVADLGSAVRRAVRRSAGRTPAERVLAAARAYVRWGLDHPGPYSVVFEGRAVRQLTREQERAITAGEDLLDELAGLLADLEPPPSEPALAAVAVWTGLHGIVALRTAKPAYPWPPIARHADAVLAGVLSAPTGTATSPVGDPSGGQSSGTSRRSLSPSTLAPTIDRPVTRSAPPAPSAPSV
jgi:AcrR family transcriptional regulator